MSRIAIIGAGLSGLTALQTLTAAGYEATVFDKSRGSGGRMASKKQDEASWDMGTQYMRAHSPEFARQLSQWQAEGLINEWSLQPAVADLKPDRMHIIPSADQITRYVGMPRMTGLSRALLDSAAEFIPAVRIVRADWIADNDAGGWQLSDDQQRTYGPFDGLIISTPPQQAIPLLSSAASLTSLCEQVEMLPCWSLLLTLAEPLPELADALFVHNSPISWVARNSSKPGRDAVPESWVIHASHDWSSRHVDDPREQVQQVLMQEFQKLSGIACSHQPAPDKVWLHRWLYSIPANPLDSGFVHDDNTPLALCGDWCHSGSLEGAWFSGRMAAGWLQQFLGN